MDRERGPAMQEPGDRHLVVGGHRLSLAPLPGPRGRPARRHLGGAAPPPPPAGGQRVRPAAATAAPPCRSPVTATWSSAAIGLRSPVSATAKDVRRVVIVADSSRTSPRQWHSASAAWPTAIDSIVAPFLLSLR